MILTKQTTKEEFVSNSIDEIYKSPENITKKIGALIIIRRENHGNEVIQDKCNKYLTELYATKYDMLYKGEQIW